MDDDRTGLHCMLEPCASWRAGLKPSLSARERACITERARCGSIPFTIRPVLWRNGGSLLLPRGHLCWRTCVSSAHVCLSFEATSFFLVSPGTGSSKDSFRSSLAYKHSICSVSPCCITCQSINLEVIIVNNCNDWLVCYLQWAGSWHIHILQSPVII